MSAHSPGPWRWGFVEVSGHKHHRLLPAGDGHPVIHTFNLGDESGVVAGNEADARLIAAAPELLAIVRDLVADELVASSAGLLQRSQDVLAKVDGG